jgi:hypothetical protein
MGSRNDHIVLRQLSNFHNGNVVWLHCPTLAWVESHRVGFKFALRGSISAMINFIKINGSTFKILPIPFGGDFCTPFTDELEDHSRNTAPDTLIHKLK